LLSTGTFTSGTSVRGFKSIMSISYSNLANGAV
jgi:hypothetical protein